MSRGEGVDEPIRAERPGLRHRVGRKVGVVATLVATALAVGLAQGWGRAERPDQAPMASSAAASSAAASSAAASSAAASSAAASSAAAVPAAAVPAGPVVLNATDDAFIQLLIPMNEGALALIDQLDTRPTDPSLRALFGEVRQAHQAELRDLRGLLAAGNMPELNIHEGHQMPGMVTDADLAELRAAPDTEVPSRAAALIRAHLAQTVVLCRGAQNAGGSPELKAIAGRIQKARAAELSALDNRPGAPVAVPVG
ncbi:uncharacterized protein (DUF305 family) [Micromonospora violae]|uniref:Uncharacterized protein (DUF305 family) n=1 Tax=Micromonospora violae TaxID=1278207 RepID=A0A4Q7UP57_9ACTN|nr:DUF305 domain-containing protein [Micromonospora violae]RZT82388.1 uncharacterized protein (DUF305 family) [Micromonospora violae]